MYSRNMLLAILSTLLILSSFSQASPTTHLVKREDIPNPWSCSVIDSVPANAQHWVHFIKPIISGHKTYTSMKGVTEHYTEVKQEVRLSNKEPHRTFKADLRGNNDFTITEYWTLAKNPTLSTSYYEIAFTDDGGLHPTQTKVIKMPPQHGNTNKFCSIHIDGLTDQRRTFTLNAYIESLYVG